MASASTTFKKGDPRTLEAGRKGGRVKAQRHHKAQYPFEGTILDVMDAAGLTGPSWKPWRAFWKAVYALPMDEVELAIYRSHTERERPPEAPVREAWMPIGRRGGKSHNAAIAALFMGTRFDTSRLAAGEVGVIPILASDRRQARQILGYLKGLFELDDFRGYVFRVLKESVELNNGLSIEVHTANYRTTRGYTCIGCLMDEVAFWRTDDGSANPDTEILTALRPSMATIPDALLLGLSTPYAARGELFKACERSFGQDDARVLVWNADTRSMNPGIPLEVIEQAYEEDPLAAASEFGSDGRVQFRRDVEVFLDPEAIRAVTIPDRRELPPLQGVRYRAFVDPSGGSQDSFTLAIAHDEGETAVLDAIREVRPPFSPDDVVKGFADFLRTYRISRVTGDRYAGEFPRELFRKYGITYEPSQLTKSDLYRELVGPINSGRVELLDLPVLRTQLQGLERRVARGGKDSIDHGYGQKDDVANSAAGSLVLTLKAQPRVNIRILGA